MLTLPPTLAAWIVATALLPETFLGESAFDAAHPSPSHEMHLLSELTFSFHPMLTYATGSFAICAASFAAWAGISQQYSDRQIDREIGNECCSAPTNAGVPS